MREHIARLEATIARLHDDLCKSRATIRALATVATIRNCEYCGRPFAATVKGRRRHCTSRCSGRAKREAERPDTQL